tara:strand:+ start:854 stop:1624 length:771 start_codon:yes stop_codon:yes gene_type:complete
MNKLFEKFDEFVKENDPKLASTSTLKMKKELNPEIWMKNKHLYPNIRKRLLKISQDFFDKLELNHMYPYDVTFTGSLANYNWSEYSDIDLHIIIDFNSTENSRELMRELIDAKRAAWNRTHDIRVFGYEVEIYVQDKNEAHISTGIYSVMKDTWVLKPRPQELDVDWEEVRMKGKFVARRIQEVYELFKHNKYRDAYRSSIKLKDRIRKLRKCGLEHGGQYSTENLAFKLLRRSDYLDKLNSLKIASYDKMMSMGT